MANKELKFIIEGVDNVSPKMKQVEGSAKSMGDGVSKYAGIAKVGILAVASAASAAAIAGIKMAKDFEKGMTNVATLVDTSVESMAEMSDQVLEISKRTPVALEDLTGGLYNVRSAGISASDAMMVLERSAQLGVAGLGSTNEAVDLATSAINAFGFSGEEASKVFDTIQATVKAGKTNISELAQSFGMVAGVAKTAGVSFEELQAATAAMTTTGQKASVAQNSIRQAILALQAPTTDMAKIIQGLGYESGESMVRQEGLVASLRMVQEATGGSAEQMKKAFGSVEALGVALSLAGEQAGAFDTIMKDMGNSSGMLDEAFRKQSETFDAQYQILKNNLNAVLIQLGSAILPLLNKAIEFIIPVIDKVSSWFSKAGENGGQMSETFQRVAGVINTQVVPIIQDAFTILQQILKALKWAWDNDFLAIRTTVTTWVQVLSGLFQSILPIIKGVFGFIAGIMTGDFGKAKESIVQMTVDLYEIWESKFNAISNIFSEVFGRIKGNFQMIVDWFSGMMAGFTASFTTAWQNLWNGIRDFFFGIWQAILKSLESSLNKAIDLINHVINAMNRVPGVSIPLIQRVALTEETKDKAQSALQTVAGIAGFGGARANGGSVSGGTPYLVGERGAEMFVPGRSGTIVPNHSLGGVTINISGNMIDSSSRINQLADEIERRLSRQMQLQKFGATI
jgi:TP901 family phage tail tape measure protein